MSLAFLDLDLEKPCNPSEIIRNWIKESTPSGLTCMNLATSSRDGHVRNRTVVIRDVLDDGQLTFLTTTQGQKIKDILENPQVAVTILLTYSKNGVGFIRQIRLEGIAEKLPREKCEEYYHKEPLYCKLRSWISQQGEKADWSELNKQYEDLLTKVKEKKEIIEKIPETEVAYKIVPNLMDLYYSFDNHIADRIIYKKAEKNWTCERIQT